MTVGHGMGLAVPEHPEVGRYVVYCLCGWVNPIPFADPLEAADTWRAHRHAAMVATQHTDHRDTEAG